MSLHQSISFSGARFLDVSDLNLCTTLRMRLNLLILMTWNCNRLVVVVAWIKNCFLLDADSHEDESIQREAVMATHDPLHSCTNFETHLEEHVLSLLFPIVHFLLRKTISLAPLAVTRLPLSSSHPPDELSMRPNT